MPSSPATIVNNDSRKKSETATAFVHFGDNVVSVDVFWSDVLRLHVWGWKWLRVCVCVNTGFRGFVQQSPKRGFCFLFIFSFFFFICRLFILYPFCVYVVLYISACTRISYEWYPPHTDGVGYIAAYILYLFVFIYASPSYCILIRDFLTMLGCFSVLGGQTSEPTQHRG